VLTLKSVGSGGSGGGGEGDRQSPHAAAVCLRW